MNDIVPPKQPLNKNAMSPARPPRPDVSTPPPPSVPHPVEPRSLQGADPAPLVVTPQKKGKKLTLWILGGLITLLLALAGAGFIWYSTALKPVNGADEQKVTVDIPAGSSPGDIGFMLEQKQLIRSKYAFDIYTRITGVRGKLQAGTYMLSPSESTEAIVAHLISGKVSELSITFLPGATLADNRKVLLDAGFAQPEVDAALKKQYDHPLFKDKPEEADLEGYIWGETYNFDPNTSVEKILVTTFDHYYMKIQDQKLIEAFSQQELNLFQGITLASIVQREVPHKEDQTEVAQVFFSRLRTDMMLGSDVTYQYAAKKLGVSPTPELNSPYNTRRFAGLPPGPIATPGISALEAVATPADGDYLYFLSGDDDVTYFARTIEEHEANIKAHCVTKCSTY